ncbi:MAG: hypothetical protein A4E42_00333 [Methanoregulaceae archaeon PtaU1.Bin222]|nr:MAG: hypothetical protein A4E42_00333 [Methanoregulaceae archaeon PtaU1.Bin222]
MASESQAFSCGVGGPSLSSSTESTTHSAFSRCESRNAALTMASAVGPGRIATRRRSTAGHGPEIARARMWVTICRSVRWARYRSVSCRRAIRFPVEKKWSTAWAAMSPRYIFPAFRRAISSSGVRSISRISSARSKNVSGTVSLTWMPVIWAMASFRLSTCWMFTVV